MYMQVISSELHTIACSWSVQSAVVREEFLYDSIIQKKLLESDDYEID